MVQVYADLTPFVDSGGNKGILNMLLDDDFENNSQLWIYYSRNTVPYVFIKIIAEVENLQIFLKPNLIQKSYTRLVLYVPINYYYYYLLFYYYWFLRH